MASMKPNLHLHLHLLFFLPIFSLLASNSAAEISLRELESAIFALRSNGYNLFGNSIAVSDLSFQILALSGGGASGFTLLAPPNSALFSLDMSADAFSYVHSLRFHVIPRRLSFSDLRNLSLSSSPYLETLVPGHLLSVASSAGNIVSVDGVRISFPDLYLRSGIAAHGLEGILSSSTVEHFHELSSVSMPPAPIDAALSPAFDGIPASPPQQYSVSMPPAFEGIPESPTTQKYSISIPPENSAFSPAFDGIHAPSPQQFSISPPETSLCGDWSGCEPDFFSPRFSPLMESILLPPINFVPEPVILSPESEAKSDCEEKKDHDSEHHEHKKPKEEESQGHDHTNFAKYNHASLL